MRTALRFLPLLAGLAGVADPAAAQISTAEQTTATPIKHLIIVVGENLTFDNLFGTYRPKAGQSVANLLSKGIVNSDGTPGANYALAAQRIAKVQNHYEVTPEIIGTYEILPQPNTTYAVARPKWVRDQRFPATLPNGPFQITHYLSYADHIGDPVHRFFQMWQQIDGGKHDLFVWVDETSGEGARNHNDPGSSTNQGSLAMGFYNMATGDAAYLKELADEFALADNYHQAVMGGTGANFIALSTGHAASYLIDGQPAVPPLNQIENPDPRPGTDNWYTESGYRGGSYTSCADPAAPGVAAIRAYLATLPYKPFNDGNCEAGHYYLINNYAPGYLPNGQPQVLGPKKFVLPPQTAPNIGTALAAAGVSWKWYSGGRKAGGDIAESDYCSICDPLTHSTAIMTGPLRTNLQALADLDHDLDEESALPAVSFVIPPNPDSGHPGYSTVARFEAFVRALVGKVQSKPKIWAKAALLITTDEGGGSYDSGYVQILDFFGDGTRISMLTVSPFAKKGVIDHTYYDHASILKFVERNWNLPPLSPRSRDHLPNPVMSAVDPYVPENRPAIGDLMNLFEFPAAR